MRIALVIAILLASRTAMAESTASERVESYRSATAIASGLSITIIGIGVATESGPVAAIGAAGFVVGAPLVHMSNGRYGRAAASVSIRVALPLLGVVIGDSFPRDCAPYPCMGPPAALYYGLGAGVVIASVLDVAFLAKGDAPAAWTPVAAPTRDGFALGIAGQF